MVCNRGRRDHDEIGLLSRFDRWQSGGAEFVADFLESRAISIESAEKIDLGMLVEDPGVMAAEVTRADDGAAKSGMRIDGAHPRSVPLPGPLCHPERSRDHEGSLRSFSEFRAYVA